MNIINEALTKFINKYLSITLAIIVSILWVMGRFLLDSETIIYIILSLTSILVLIYAKDGFPYIPIAIFTLLVPSNGAMKFNNVPIGLIILIIIYIISMILYVIKNKINIFVGKLRWSNLALTIVLILVSLRFNNDIPIYIYLFLLVLPMYLFYYLFFSSTIKGDNRLLLAELFIYAGLIISLQSLIYVIETPIFEIIENIKKGESYSIYWSHSNIGAIVLNMTIGLTLTSILLKPNKIWYQLSLLPQIFALLLTVSRGGIAIFGFMFLCFLVIYYIYRPSNKHYFTRLSLLLIGVVIIYLLIPDVINNLITFFITSLKGTDPLTGRMKLYEDAIKQFKTNILFGTGIFGAVDVFKKTVDGVIHISYGFRSYHSMILQILACSGLVGLLAVIYNYYEIIKLLINKIDKFKISIIIVILAVTIYGMFDNVYLMVHYTLLAYPLFAVIEIKDVQDIDKDVYNINED